MPSRCSRPDDARFLTTKAQQDGIKRRSLVKLDGEVGMKSAALSFVAFGAILRIKQRDQQFDVGIVDFQWLAVKREIFDFKRSVGSEFFCKKLFIRPMR